MIHSTLPFDLVVLDLDGTIIDLYHTGGVSPRVRATIAAVQAAGIPVTIGTGRTLDYIREHLADLNLTHPVVTMQGAVIGDPITGEILVEQSIPLVVARQVAQWVDESGLVATFYFHDDAGRVRIYQNRLPDQPEDQLFHDHVFGGVRTVQGPFVDLLAALAIRPPLKFLVDNDPTRTTDVVPALQERFGTVLTITRTHPRLVEGTTVGSDKGQGIQHLCQMLKIDPLRVLAIGDNDNDIPMLKAVGYGVAMGNATPGAKAVAQWVAPSVEEDGAAVALEKFILRAVDS